MKIENKNKSKYSWEETVNGQEPVKSKNVEWYCLHMSFDSVKLNSFSMATGKSTCPRTPNPPAKNYQLLCSYKMLAVRVLTAFCADALRREYCDCHPGIRNLMSDLKIDKAGQYTPIENPPMPLRLGCTELGKVLLSLIYFPLLLLADMSHGAPFS